MNERANARKVLNLLKVEGGGTIKTIATSLGMELEDVKTALRHLVRREYINRSGENGFYYVGRFVWFEFSTGGETRAGSVIKREILNGHDALLETERIALMNRTGEEFTVTFTLTGIESAELVRRFAFVVDEETGKMLTKLCRETSGILKRPLIEKKAFSFDRLLPEQTKKYCLEFLVDREFIEKVPKNELKCTLKIDCISLNYHDFVETSIRLTPGWC